MILVQPIERLLRITASCALALCGACLLGFYGFEPAAAQSATDRLVYLDQGWSQADRETYYQISQGSQVIDYDIFLNLEVANSQELFRSDTNSERYGLIPQVANPRTNPDALPVGMSKTVVMKGRWKGEYVGLTCATCHVAQLAYKGKRIRIDGGVNNTFDLMSYCLRP